MRCLHLGGSICIGTTRLLNNAPGKFFFTYRQVLGNVIENLSAIMRRAIRPTTGRVSSLNRVADIFAIALTYLPDDTMPCGSYISRL